MLISVADFIGHFHPVLVHIPIGILLLACLFQWLSRKEKFSTLQSAVNITLLLGMLGAIIACITGWLLSKSEDYDEQLKDRHQWFGISVALASIMLYYMNRRSVNVKTQSAVAVLLFGLIVITGHLGGSLTHGSDFLTKSLKGSNLYSEIKRKPIPNIQEALAYTDIIQPLLQNKCYNCHGENRHKGGLRMDQADKLMKGGKDGVVIVPGNTEKSEMTRRLLLPREDEDHMPPKEKSQLKEDEIALIHWWIESGASFTKRVKELEQSEKMKPILLALQQVEIKSVPDIPTKPVEKANETAMQKLKERGVVIIPVAQNTNYLLANFVTADKITDSEMTLLLPLKKQLVWLKLGNSFITDSALKIISQLTNVVRLQLDHTNITDHGLADLKSLQNLRYLNLVNTKITAKGLLQLKELKNLQSIYLYQTDVAKSDWGNLIKAFPKTRIDSGGYTIPFLATDTIEVKQPVVKE